MYSEVRKASEEAGDGFSVSGVLKRLNVSKSGYYDWLRRGPSNRERKRLQFQQDIMDIYEDSHQIYGAPKITEKLKSEGKVYTIGQAYDEGILSDEDILGIKAVLNCSE